MLEKAVRHCSNTKSKAVTKRKIGKVLYFVEASSSDTAADTIESKIEKLILRNCEELIDDGDGGTC